MEPEDADPMPEGMCQNSSTIGFNMVYTTRSGAMANSLIDKSTMLTVVIGGLVLGWFL